MKKRVERNAPLPVLVVDASVARAAGDKAEPPSGPCRAALQQIDQMGYDIAMDRDLKNEWEDHWSNFSRRWLVTMRSRRRTKVPAVWDGVLSLLDAASDLEGHGPEEVAKDVHLVGLAVQTDRRVVSHDTRQRTLLRRLDLPAEVHRVHWVDPVDDGALGWLEAGTPEDARWWLVVPPGTESAVPQPTPRPKRSS